MFGGGKKEIKLEDCLLKPERAGTGSQSECGHGLVTSPTTQVDKPKGIETGKHVLEDPKWSVVNAKAKAHWAAFFGKRSVEEFANGD